MCAIQRGDKKCYCGSSRYGSSYTYHKTSACQYFWRVHTYATDALLAYMTENMSYFGSLVKSFSGTQLICITSSSQQMLTLHALSNKPTDMTALSPCQQDEADTRIFIMLLGKVTRRPFSGL